MDHILQQRQTIALDLCPYVSWDRYDWHDIIQCNFPFHGVKIPWNPAIYCIIASTHALAVYMSLEILVRTLLRFKNWKTLYFWSLIATSLGLIGSIISSILLLFILPHYKNNSGFNALAIISSILCQTGFSTVLYSRLHLVVQDRRILRGLLILLVLGAFGLHTPSMAAYIVGASGSLQRAYALYKQVFYVDIGFSVQESIFAGVYIWGFWKYLNDLPQHAEAAFKREKRIVFSMLIAVSFVVFTFDVMTVVLLCKGLVLVRNMVVGLMYAIKLNFEFVVLNRLVSVGETKRTIMAQGNFSHPVLHQSDFTASGESNEDKRLGVQEEFIGSPVPSPISLISDQENEPKLQIAFGENDEIQAEPRGIRSAAYLGTNRLACSNASFNDGPEQGSGTDTDSLERQYLGQYLV